MATPMPTILVGVNEAAGAASMKVATNFEIVHFVLADAATKEVPILLSGEKLDESSRSSKIGTNDYSKKIQLLLFAPSLSAEQISEVEKVVESKGLDEGVRISKYDTSRPLPAVGDPEYVQEVTDRGQAAFKKWLEGGSKGKLVTLSVRFQSELSKHSLSTLSQSTCFSVIVTAARSPALSGLAAPPSIPPRGLVESPSDQKATSVSLLSSLPHLHLLQSEQKGYLNQLMLAALLISALLPSAFGFPRVRNSSPFGLSHGPLNEWWRCHGDWEKSCVLQEVDLRLDSNLTECGTVRLDWDAADIPEINAITYRLLAIPSWPAAPVDPDEWKTYQANVSLPVQEFITPARSIEWTVNYPAGTEVQFQLDAYSDNVYYKGVNNFTISTGDDHCIPIAHKPVFVTLPTQLYQCEQGMFSWSGGMEPVTAIFTGGHPGWYFVEQPTVQRLGNHSYVEYGNKFPAGAELEFVIQDADGDILAQNSYMIRAGGRKCHINRDYLVHRWWRQPAAIAGLTIGGVAALLLLGVGAFFGGRYYKKRYGGSIALPADEEQETVEPQETVEH